MGRERIVRASGLAAVAVYSACIIWLYVRQPQNIKEVTGSMAAGVGAYRIDQQAFDDGLRFFRRDQFAAARAAFERADAAGQDARTQFYIAYSYYREGWGRIYIDAESFRRGLDHVNKAIALAPGGRLILDDANLQMRSADELKAELEAGLRREAADFNPLKVFRRRK
jgi:tetratricopeptide (TPR) repeat protein